MAFSDWSTTAASNVLATTGVNFDEGQTPGSVNNSARELMAQLKAGVQPLDEDLTAIAALGYTSGDYLIKKTAANTYSLIALTAAGAALLDDAAASNQRTTLGLGTAATQDTGTSGANVPLLNGTNTWANDQRGPAANSSPALNDETGWALGNDGVIHASANGVECAQFNRRSNDGVIAYFRQAGTAEGSVSVSATTVSYNAFMGSHWAQLPDGSKPEVLLGSVMETVDQMCVWPGERANERLPCAKVSDTAESERVYGTFFGWDEDLVERRHPITNAPIFDKDGKVERIPPPTNDMYVAALGAGFVRVNGAFTVSGGQLLDSNGDGTAKPQADGIVRTRTIAKVSSATPVNTYPDGSYVVPCVLMCG